MNRGRYDNHEYYGGEELPAFGEVHGVSSTAEVKGSPADGIWTQLFRTLVLISLFAAPCAIIAFFWISNLSRRFSAHNSRFRSLRPFTARGDLLDVRA
jgi:hypothetical protein